MRNRFRSYYQLTEKELEALWKDGLISVDANVLLNLYRYSSRTRSELLKLLRGLGERLWLSHQAGLEFHKHRLDVIFEQRDKYNELLKEFGEIIETLKSTRGHPFVTARLEARLERDFQILKRELTKNARELEQLESTDRILDEITKIFSDRVGTPFSDDELKQIKDEGQQRYKRRIPPGYGDEKKPEDERYGDLILWKELQREGAARKIPLIFVTDDAKEDWWQRVKGKTIGPLPDLREEMMAATGKPFHMYSTNRFMEHAATQLKRQVQKQAIMEVQAAAEQKVDAVASFRQRLIESSRPAWSPAWSETLPGARAAIAAGYTGVADAARRAFESEPGTLELLARAQLDALKALQQKAEPTGRAPVAQEGQTADQKPTETATNQ